MTNHLRKFLTYLLSLLDEPAPTPTHEEYKEDLAVVQARLDVMNFLDAFRGEHPETFTTPDFATAAKLAKIPMAQPGKFLATHGAQRLLTEDKHFVWTFTPNKEEQTTTPEHTPLDHYEVGASN